MSNSGAGAASASSFHAPSSNGSLRLYPAVRVLFSAAGGDDFLDVGVGKMRLHREHLSIGLGPARRAASI